MKIALIGYGYWGKKTYQALLNFTSKDNIVVVDPIAEDIPAGVKTELLENVLLKKNIHHILIATPEETHFKIAKRCLQNKKNIFVEKPLCLKKDEAKELHLLAKKNNLKIYVDYIFLYDPYVKKAKKIIQNHTLGNLLKIKSVRHSININKPNISVLSDLAIHDIYLGKYFFNKKCEKVEISNISRVKKHTKQALVTYYYGDKKIAADYSWIKPIAKRVMTFIGNKSSLVWDRNETELLIYKNQKLTKKIKVEKTKSPLELSIKKFLFGNNIYNYINDIETLEKLNYL